MYFPTSSAKVLRPSAASTPHDLPPLPASLADIAKLGGAHDEVLVGMAAQTSTSWRSAAKGRRGRKLAAVLGGAELGIWSIRPALLLCKIKRTGTSLRRYGLNRTVVWLEDPEADAEQCSLLVLTTKSYIFQYSITALGPTGQTPVYSVPSTGTGAQKGQFVAGSGEGLALPPLVIEEVGYLDFSESDVAAICATPTSLIVSTANPPALHSIDYGVFQHDLASLEDDELSELEHLAYMSELRWVVDPSSYFTDVSFNRVLGLFVFISSDGRAYAVKDLSLARRRSGRRPSSASDDIDPSLPPPDWDGQCFYGNTQSPDPEAEASDGAPPLRTKATSIAFNERFSLVSLGLQNGQCALYSILMPSQAFMQSHQFSLRHTLKSTAPHLDTGPVTCQTWTSDGYALAVGWQLGWSVWTVYGKLTTWAVGGDTGGAEGGEPPPTFEDRFMNGISSMFWGPGNFELFALCDASRNPKGRTIDEQLFIIPFAKSAVTGLHTPDNTNHAFLQLDDGLLVYRGADQPDMSVINPESDVWQSIKIPASYISNNWPIRYACISSDARLIAVAGRRGFTHYNSLSGRWKLFDNDLQEQSFRIAGGMQWYQSTFVVATEEEGEDEEPVFKLRLFARDRPLNTAYTLDEEQFPSRIVLTSLFDSSLLVYTEDNTFYHFLLTSAKDGPRLRLCGSIGFEGVVSDPRRVRGLSWMVPKSQQHFGDPSEDLNFATVIFLIEGKLVLLRPRRAIRDEVKYDMQILADRIEFYWTHLAGIGTLENSLWGWDGERIRVWLNALTIDMDQGTSEAQAQQLGTVEESLAINIDFYPLSVLMDKGIIVGVEHETSYRRSLDFAIFRLITTTHLFLHHVLRFHLSHSQTREAVIFASHYQHLVYFAHALEILLHAVLEDEADSLPSSGSPKLSMSGLHTRSLSLSHGPPVPANAVLPKVVDFLDHFAEALQVVVNCARKTEITRWAYLFQFVGKPRDLFEKCMAAGQLKIAASYLLVLHSLEPLEQSSRDTIRLLKVAMAKDDWQLCKELSRFLYSLDHTGTILQTCLAEAGALPSEYAARLPAGTPGALPGIMSRKDSVGHDALGTETAGPSIRRSSSVPVTLADAGKLAAPLAHAPLSAAVPFQRTGSTARALHYRMSSMGGGGGLGLGTLLSRVGTPPGGERLRPLSRKASASSLTGAGTGTGTESVDEAVSPAQRTADGEREADDD